MKSEITETREVYGVWTNTDLTEGRGFQIPIAFCDAKSTAIRLGEKKYVQGNDCPIDKTLAFRINNTWYVPGRIQGPSSDDQKKDRELEARDAAYSKAKELGLNDEDIVLLRKLYE